MLQEAGFDATAGGNLGTALSARRSRRRARTSLHVVEVSSFQLETTDTFHPWIAVLLNLSPDHLDRHASFEEYARGQGAHLRESDAPTTGRSSTPTIRRRWRWRAGGRARRFDFALDAPLRDGVTVEGGDDRAARSAARPRRSCRSSSVQLPGRHLLGDVLAATAVGCVAGVPPAAMQRAVEGFAASSTRSSASARSTACAFVNDSKATNIASARTRASRVSTRGVVAIMGGRFKGGALRGSARRASRARATPSSRSAKPRR